MTTLELAYEAATLFAENLPDHTGQVARYVAAGLTNDTAKTLERRAARIITLGRQTILEIGVELLAAREEAQHNTWLKFLDRAGIEERTAQNYMNVAKRFADKPEIISALPPTSLYALAAPNADPALVGEIIAEVTDGARLKVEEVKHRLNPARPIYQPVKAAAPSLDDEPSGMVNPLEDEDGYEDDEELLVTQVAAHTCTVVPTPDQPAASLPPGLPVALGTASLPPTLTMVGAAPVGDVAVRKLLFAKLSLLRSALELLEIELVELPIPARPVWLDIDKARVRQAAQNFVTTPALNTAASMLSLSAVVEQVGE